MAKKSIKENKSPYQLRREELGLSREQASELLGTIPPERIQRLENGAPHPDEVLVMADKYRMPDLCNYYCSHECPIGQQYVPEIKVADLSVIVLKMLDSLNQVAKEKDRLVEIAADGRIDDEEIRDFVSIQEKLDQISVTVDTLRLWADKMLAEGAINMEVYNAHRTK